MLDGRSVTVKGYEKGFYLGPTLFDHVKPGMTVGDREIFGPVLCVKRVKNFEEGIALMNASEFANGSVIYTQTGYFAREFARRTHGGMVGINVGIPVPLGMFGFTGHKNSFFGDLHTMGTDGIRFFTEWKSVTAALVLRGGGPRGEGRQHLGRHDLDAGQEVARGCRAGATDGVQRGPSRRATARPRLPCRGRAFFPPAPG